MNDTVGGTVAGFAAVLATAGFDEPRRRARRLVAGGLDLAPADLLAHPERTLASCERAGLDALLARLLAGEPVSRIFGRREFWGLDFALSPHTLDPRPETETVVEAVLKRLPEREAPLHLLDLGTGSGCILLALLHEYPRAFGIGIDIAAGAAATARANAAALGLAARAVFLVGDWAAALAARFDVIVSNPPYIETTALAELPRAVTGYDPPLALDGGADGLACFRAIAATAPELLRAGGVFTCEVGAGQAAQVAAIAAAAGLASDGVEYDLGGIARAVVARAPAVAGGGKK